jgi:hypothetical protein
LRQVSASVSIARHLVWNSRPTRRTPNRSPRLTPVGTRATPRKNADPQTRIGACRICASLQTIRVASPPAVSGGTYGVSLLISNGWGRIKEKGACSCAARYAFRAVGGTQPPWKARLIAAASKASESKEPPHRRAASSRVFSGFHDLRKSACPQIPPRPPEGHARFPAAYGYIMPLSAGRTASKRRAASRHEIML